MINPTGIFDGTRTLLLILLALIFWGGNAEGQHGSASSATPNPAPTPVPLTKVRLEAQSALNSLEEIEARASTEQSELGVFSDNLSKLNNEIDTRSAEDGRILTGSTSLDLLFRLKQTWLDIGKAIFLMSRDLTPRAMALEEDLARLDQFKKTWLATLETTKQSDVPQQALQRAQSVLDAIEKIQNSVISANAQVWKLQSTLSAEETRVRTAFTSIERSQNIALRSLLVTDSAPIWSLKNNLSSEWEKHGSESFSSQLNASVAFAKRLPFSFLTHALLILIIAIAIQRMRLRIQKSAEEKPDLRRALPILDLPFSTAFVLSILISPSLYGPAPRLIQAVMGSVALIPTILILRHLLERSLFPILNALVGMYFVGQLRVLLASLPVLERFLFLAQMLGGLLLLIWQLRYWHSRNSAADTGDRFLLALRIIARVGLFLLPGAFLANISGYAHLGNLFGTIFLRSVYLAALFYAVIRVLEGLITIVLQVRPMGSLRVVSLHRPMLQRRACRTLEVLAFLFWLNLILNFFGLLTPLITTIEAILEASFSVGSIKISLGPALAFVVAVWSSFLISGFLRFVLEEDVYEHFHLQRGVPYAISTVLHYVILLFGFFIGLGALGIDLSKITLLAGAFSVGIGFGLQNVINNFVSGLILLFERPIKIGDVIEVAGNLGEVRRIGIRASVIRTADGSEVIVPNGSLISSQVTNWTYSDRQRAIEITVSVIGGTDPQRVVELLKKTSLEHPGVAKEPSPQVYVVGFTSGAINLQLRAWTDRYRDWAQLRSDLSIAVNAALDRESIAIP